jgi:hypothetical protein
LVIHFSCSRNEKTRRSGWGWLIVSQSRNEEDRAGRAWWEFQATKKTRWVGGLASTAKPQSV